MNSSKHETYLKILSIVIIFLAVINGVIAVLDYAILTDSELPVDAAGAALAKHLFIGILVLTALTALARIYIGIMGLAQLKGREGRSHIVVAKVLFVFGVISCISVIVGIFNGTQEFSALHNPLTDVIFVGCFISQANAVMKQDQFK